MKTIEELKKLCGIKGELIDNGDGTYDVVGDVVLPKEAAKIPIKFRNVSGNFSSHSTEATPTLAFEGKPEKVGGFTLVSMDPISEVVKKKKKR